MPTYEYLCEACGKRFDYFQPMTDAPLKKCLCCRRGKVKRQIGTGAGLIFKGSGFYCTDYRSDSYRKAATKDTSPPKEAPAAAKPDKTTTSDTAPKTKPAASKGD
jgi:putative FmdB family regulatory protein